MKWVELFDVFIRSITSLIVLFFITKLLGKKQVSQLSLFDYVIGISIGNFAAEMTVNLESQIVNGLFAVVIFGIIAYTVSWLTMKSIRLRRFFMGTPTIVIQEGKLLEKGLKRCKMDINDLLEQCRSNGYFDINQIEYAILEINGSLSVLPKAQYRPVNNNDLSKSVSKEGLYSNVVIDGKIMHNNLSLNRKDEKWLRKQLKIKGYQDLNTVLLATLDCENKLQVYERNENVEPYKVLE